MANVPTDVCCDRISKRYRLAERRKPGSLRQSRQDFWALRNVSFEVRRGEALGIIGRNGAGKSTILKLLEGITAPTEGEITIRGRLAALIEIGSGFHPELTGRENAFLSGTILGLRRREITARLPSIAEFSGIGAFLDTPVKFYSSGMYVRLGFAIAAHLEPDVLLVDEVLAVGDAEFQARCFARIQELKRRGTTMILVSHDLGAIEQMCDRALLVERGTIAASGETRAVISAYQGLAAGANPTLVGAANDDAGAAAAGLQIAGLTLHAADGSTVLTTNAGAALIARATLDATAPFADVEVVLSFYDFERGTLLVELSSRIPGQARPLAAGTTRVDFVIPELLLAPGVYTLGITATPDRAARPVAWRFGRTTLYVEGQGRRGTFLLPYECRTSTAPSRPAALTV
jgi:ABC-type polysaccharide/polyol phosphate transport system ATPase subunit